MKYHAKLPPQNHQQAGFTLLEMAMVSMVIAIVVGMSVSSSTIVISNAKTAGTNNRIKTIETALLAYRLANNRLPCPADRTIVPTDAVNGPNWGYQASAAGDCYSTGTIRANFATNIVNTYANSTVTVNNGVVEGVVPVRTLGLPDEFMYDGWGTKIGYAVTAAMTDNNAFINYGNLTNCGMITVKNTTISNPPYLNPANRTTMADYALVSYGSTGHGGYNAQSTTAAINAGVTNADALANCHCDSTGTSSSYSATYVQEDQATSDHTNVHAAFDDVVRFKERFQLNNIYDEFNPGGNLSCPTALPGIRIDGNGAGAKFGYSVAVGDVNGDGIPDLVVGSPGFNSSMGAVYVFFGSLTGFTDPVSLASLNGTNGFIVTGAAQGDQFGSTVVVGDINGDGVSDIIVSAWDATVGGTLHVGSVFVIFGGTGTWPTSGFSATALNGHTGVNGTSGFRINGVTSGDKISQGNITTADINGDGYADIVIGAPAVLSNIGRAYVVYGNTTSAPTNAWPTGTPAYTLDSTATTGLMDTKGNSGFRIDGTAASNKVGINVVAGDINGDGIADILISSYDNTDAGVGYVLYGHRSKWTPIFSLSSIDGHNGFAIQGVNTGNPGDETGITSVADVNGDGIGDIILTSHNFNSTGGASKDGAVYLVFGRVSPFPKQVSLATPDGKIFSRIDGVVGGGNQMDGAIAGDLNGDGNSDISLLAINGANTSVYTLFGTGTWASTTNINTINGTTGFELDNATGRNASANGRRICYGDVNGDGRIDLIYGDINALGGNTGAGSVYIIYGQRKSTAWTNPYNLSGL